jgi:hypothetical protein
MVDRPDRRWPTLQSSELAGGGRRYVPGDQGDRPLDQVEHGGAVDVDEIEVEPEVLSGVDLPAIETNAIERLVFPGGLYKTIGARLPRHGLRLIERQAVGIDARLVRGGHQLQIEAAPAPWPAIGDDLDHRKPQKTGGRGYVKMAGAAVVDLEHGGSRPADLLDQHDRVVLRTGAARRQQARAAGMIAERHAGRPPGLRAGIAGGEAERRKAGEAACATPCVPDDHRCRGHPARQLIWGWGPGGNRNVLAF